MSSAVLNTNTTLPPQGSSSLGGASVQSLPQQMQQLHLTNGQPQVARPVPPPGLPPSMQAPGAPKQKPEGAHGHACSHGHSHGGGHGHSHGPGAAAPATYVRPGLDPLTIPSGPFLPPSFCPDSVPAVNEHRVLAAQLPDHVLDTISDYVGLKHGLFVVGGYDPIVQEESLLTDDPERALGLTEAFMWTPEAKDWLFAKPLTPGRISAEAACWDGRIYVLGGHHHTLYAPLRDGFVLDTRTNAWMTLPPMPTPRFSDHRVACLDQRLYVIGGNEDTPIESDWKVTNKVHIMDISNGRWMIAAPMHYARGRFGLVPHNGLLYAIGGYHSPELPARTAEVYHPRENRWHLLPPLPESPCVWVGAFVRNGLIYALGELPGYVPWTVNELDWVAVFDPAKNAWALTRLTTCVPNLQKVHGYFNDCLYVTLDANSPAEQKALVDWVVLLPDAAFRREHKFVASTPVLLHPDADYPQATTGEMEATINVKP